jgi:pectate lyase
LTSKIRRAFALILFLALDAPTTDSSSLAFEGFGSSTPGGNNGAIVEVTSLADSGPGTLREALAGSNRHIVFAVAGSITLSTDISVRNRSFITVDGSTAPSPGITIQGRGITLRDNSHDIVLTHLRIRNAGNDGIAVQYGAYNVVIDHCSVTDSVDGNIDITEGAHDVTVQWTILGYTRTDWYAFQSRGMLINNSIQGAVQNVSLHHNFWINNMQRSPEVSSTNTLIDIRNNVFWDWGARATRFNQGGRGNVVNNIYVKVTNLNSNLEDALVLQSDAGAVHVSGNLGPAGRNINTQSTAAAPFNVAPVATDPAADVEEILRQSVGAFPRDSVDTSLVGAPDSGTLPTTPPPAVNNFPPNVNAGTNQTINMPGSASLDGTVKDDGLPAAGNLTTTWTRVSGPGSVNFANPTAIDTTASFSTAGTYVLRLRANDGELSTSDDVAITVNPPPPPPPSAGQAVTSFTLINADTDQPIATFDPLNNGVTLNLDTLPTRNLNIRANTSPATVGSIRFGWDRSSTYRIDNSAPYALGGNNSGNYYSWRPSPGTHSLTARPYTRSDARGTAGTAMTITFRVVD